MSFGDVPFSISSKSVGEVGEGRDKHNTRDSPTGSHHGSLPKPSTRASCSLQAVYLSGC